MLIVYFFLLDANLCLELDQLRDSLFNHTGADSYFLRDKDGNWAFHYHEKLSAYIAEAKQFFIFFKFFQLHVHCYLDERFLGLNSSLLEKFCPFEIISKKLEVFLEVNFTMSCCIGENILILLFFPW